MKKYFIFVASLLLLQIGEKAYSQNYNLFKPIPREKMRELNTDRPDITESPISVDAGHFQLETDLFKTTSNKGDGFKTFEDNFNVANLKLGLTNNTDLQLVVQSYVATRAKDLDGNKIFSNSGFGDLTLRVKQNLWGNDQGKTAFAIMPFVNIPTAKGSKYYEPGVVFPFSLELKNDFSFGTQVQFDLLKSDDADGYHGSFLQSVVLGKGLTENVETFVESYYTYDFKDEQFQLSFNGGLSYLFTPNLKLDAGFNLGLTKNTDKVYFIGLSSRY